MIRFPSLSSSLINNHKEDIGLTRYIVVLVLIILVGSMFQWLYFQPKLGTDAQIWIDVASHLGNGQIEYHKVYYGRIFWTGFLAIWMLIFPLTVENSVVLLVLLSAVSTALVAETIRTVGNRLSALVAAVLFSTHPITITYSTFLVADVLALPMFIASLFFLFRYLASNRFRYLLFSAFVAGLCFSVKSYMVMAFFPALFIYAYYKFELSKKFLIRVSLVVMAFYIAILLGHLARWVFYSDALWLVNNNQSYAERLMERGGAILLDAGNESLLKALLVRLDYVVELYWRSGIFAAFWGIFATSFLLLRCFSSVPILVVSGLFIFFFFFFSFAPVQFSPLVFVEMQARYLVLLVTLLSMAGGLATAAMLSTTTARKLSIVILLPLIIIILTSLIIPNITADHHYNRYKAFDHMAIKNIVRGSVGLKLEELVLSDSYQSKFDEELMHQAVAVTFANMLDPAAIEYLTTKMKASDVVGVFVRRRNFPSLAENIRIDELNRVHQYGRASDLVEKFESEGIQRTPVFVPYSPLRQLADRLGLEIKGELVGWVYRSL